MKLQIESIAIKDIAVGSESYVSDHILHMDTKALKKILLEDEKIKDVEINVVYPGDGARVINVVDVIQPRCKIDRNQADFPGWLDKLEIAGRGMTRSLEDVSVVVCNRSSRRPYAAILDMSGKGAVLSRYGKMRNIILDPIPFDNVDERDFEFAVKRAGLKTAAYVAQIAEGHPVDQSDLYELALPGGQDLNLPRVAYGFLLYTPQHDYKGIPDPILYATEVSQIFPILLHPNEILDGALVNAQTIRGMETYSIQNHAVIRELYKRHGKDLIFVGVVGFAATLEPVRKQKNAMMAANLISNALAADGVILNKVHGGMPQVDLALVAEACEDLGVKTSLFVQLWGSHGSLSDGLLFGSDALNAVINTGRITERIHLPRADEILGGNAETKIYNPDRYQRAGDGDLEIEGMLLAGFHDFIGGDKIIAAQY